MDAPNRFDSPFGVQSRFAEFAARGVRIAKYMAISFGLAVVGGIAIGAAVADNAFVQIFVTVLAGFVLWLPILMAGLWVDGRVRGWRARASAPPPNVVEATAVEVHWSRLTNAAPAFPLATSAILPLRSKAESSGSGDFSPLWAGQNVRSQAPTGAADLTRQLAPL